MVPERGAVPLPLAPRAPALPNAFSSIVSQQFVPSLPGASRGSRLELRAAPDSSYRLQGFLFLFWGFFFPRCFELGKEENTTSSVLQSSAGAAGCPAARHLSNALPLAGCALVLLQISPFGPAPISKNGYAVVSNAFFINRMCRL